MKLTRLIVIGLLACVGALAETKYGRLDPTFLGLPGGTSLPVTCTVKDIYFLTTATAGQNLYSCTATNTWTLQSGSASGNYIPFPGSRYARWWIYDTNSTAGVQTGTGMYLTLTAATITSQNATATTRYAARIASSTAATNVAIGYSKNIARPAKLPFARWTVSNIPTDGRVWIGLSSNGASTATGDTATSLSIAAWRLSATASDTNWQCYVAGGGGGSNHSITDSGVSGASTDDATDHEFDVRVTATGAIFTLDGVERCNITTAYVPTGNMQAFAAVNNLALGAARSIDLVSGYTEEDR